MGAVAVSKSKIKEAIDAHKEEAAKQQESEAQKNKAEEIERLEFILSELDDVRLKFAEGGGQGLLWNAQHQIIAYLNIAKK